MRTHLPFGALLLTAVFSILPHVCAARPQPETSKSNTPESHVNISGGLSGSEVQTGKSVLFWVTIENESASNVDKLTVQLDVAKDEFTVTCLSAASGADQSICGPFKEPLLKKQAVTVRGELRSLKTTQLRNINAIVSFDSTLPERAASVSLVREISLGQLVGRSWQLQFFLTYKELVLPLVVLIAGWYLNRRQEAVQTQRAQVAETWNSMLPISHKFTLRYYMPMSKALLRVSEDVKKFTIVTGSSPVSPTLEALSIYFHTMQFWWRFKLTVDGKAAIYFKNRTGEKLVLAAFSEFRSKYKGEGLGRFDVERRTRAITRAFTPELEFPEFWADFSTSPHTELAAAFDSGWQDFVSWYFDADKRTRSLAVLEVFRLVLEFEANRPYQKWYNSQEPLGMTKTQKAVLMSLAKTKEERREFKLYFKAGMKGDPD